MAEINFLEEVPKISLLNLEKILKHLPEPTNIEVALFGNFDYSDISHQAQKTAGVKLKDAGGLVFQVKNPSKEKILSIYKKSHEKRDEVIKADERRLDLYKVWWHIQHADGYTHYTHIELTTWGVEVKYRAPEPDYILKMRQELAETNVRLSIKVNQ